ncbi:MAG: hypothetical protein QM820_11360 [Minicystis sp.]
MLKEVLGTVGCLSFTAMAAFLVGCPSSPATSPNPSGPPPVATTAAPTAPPPASTPATTATANRGGPAPQGASTPAPPGTKKSCNTNADCATNELCQGEEGCGAPWTCGPPKPCTRDSVEWCACDGTNFRGSGTCPMKPVRHRGKC